MKLHAILLYLQAMEEAERVRSEARAQSESLERRLQEAEARLGAVQREKAAAAMEKQLLKDSLAQKEQQCQMETQVGGRNVCDNNSGLL